MQASALQTEPRHTLIGLASLAQSQADCAQSEATYLSGITGNVMYVVCLSRVRWKSHARFWGEEGIVICPPYPTCDTRSLQSEWSEMTPISVHIGSRLHTGKGNTTVWSWR